jgi:energy-converting hydrogenase Eha subunit B
MQNNPSKSEALVAATFTVIYNGLCAQKFQAVQILPQLQKSVRTKLSVSKIINLKSFVVNTVIRIATKIVFASTSCSRPCSEAFLLCAIERYHGIFHGLIA